MQEDQLVGILNERIKELMCLYEISNIAASIDMTLEDQLQSIVQFLPKAWQYPDHAVSELNFDTKFFFSESLPTNYVSQKHVISINQQERGYLAIHYDATVYQKSAFLPEEQLLLKTLSQEVASIIERNEQKKREELIQRKFQHNDRLAILGEITAGIAHELNTPLGNILGFSQLIQERTSDGQIKQDTEKIIDSVMHSREVVKKLMFFSCEMPQQMQELSINVLIEDALDLLKFTTKSADINIHFTCDDGDINAQVDPVQFTQVVFNLLINAIHASARGQKILVALKSSQLKFALIIEDFGHGMKESIKEKIFEPFFTTKPIGKGSGLGLSVVHGIVKSHAGEIIIDSEENRGSTFKVIFPLIQPNE